MSESEAKKRRKAIRKRYDVLWDRLSAENPEIREEVNEFMLEIQEVWKKVSPFIGEERVYGRMDLTLNDDYKTKGFALDFIVWFVLFRRIFEKLDKELEWLEKNREILKMMVKEYLEAQRFR